MGWWGEIHWFLLCTIHTGTSPYFIFPIWTMMGWFHCVGNYLRDGPWHLFRLDHGHFGWQIALFSSDSGCRLASGLLPCLYFEMLQVCMTAVTPCWIQDTAPLFTVVKMASMLSREPTRSLTRSVIGILAGQSASRHFMFCLWMRLMLQLSGGLKVHLITLLLCFIAHLLCLK